MSEDNKDLLDFVKRLTEEGARKMEFEKITPDLVHLMSDDELRKYILIHGDRLRLRQHFKDENNQSKRKNKLLTVLHQKLEKARKTEIKKIIRHQRKKVKTCVNSMAKKNAVKGTRYLELGWIHKIHKRTKQVRSKTGGGTRKVCMPKDATRNDILDEAKKSFFFPNGQSPKGNISEFNYDIWDFSERVVRYDMTLQKMYEETKMPMLRFYLATWGKKDTDNAPESDLLNHSGHVEDNKEINITTSHSEIPNKAQISTTDMISKAIEISGIVPEFDLSDSDKLPDPFNVQFDNGDVIVPQYEQERKKDAGSEVKVRVHSGHILKDIILAFMTIDPEKNIISFEMIMPNGMVEVAEDGGGVTRDSLTEFWKEFYENCTIGTSKKVPFLRHDFGEEEWGAVTKIIFFGWVSQGYFPLQLSLPFLQQSTFSQYTADLLEAFYKVIPEQERACLQMALSNYSQVEEDELMDILDAHEVRQLPNQSNIARLVMEMAHKELIQAPMFVADCWNNHLRNIGFTENKLLTLYNEMKPTPRGVCKALCFPDGMNQDESLVCNHLKRFIRELNDEKLGKFVRF